MIAALPMYDRAENRAATDRYWSLIRAGLIARGIDAPQFLRRDDAELMPQWTDPSLLLSQTCGFPFRAKLHGRVQLVGTPDFGVGGCPPGYYRSVLIARRDDPRRTLADFDGAALAYNDAMSQSGWAAPQTHAAKLGLTLRAGVQTGSHAASLAAVATGRADLAALDAVTWSLLAEHDPQAAAVHGIALTDPTPGLPYITAAGRDSAGIFEAIAGAIGQLDATQTSALRLRGIVYIPAETYLAVPTPPAPDALAPEK
ncbi:phosphate/phosphite/phosphonate ABC transporter substrate-binding protein [Paragemmobacter straminiformis]|uniref:PhnD/SsuA/transferrin family substrate-binding protein n=1 Tax=Paragemmobacter straminiformis TaxID=2045119 RepID=A0A842I1J3_9RHOB|nr:PhnD/SsuA/transferrin family substrate-binding protein [Gemmobacter straminiformis]MBC2833960.1 PhnD/SsuA/transferrin family substrate-binding protein [Gemmobacter straminiformis]